MTNALFNHPSESIGCMTAAAMIVTAVNGVFNSHLQVRIQNYGPLTPYKDIKANLVGKLVAVMWSYSRPPSCLSISYLLFPFRVSALILLLKYMKHKSNRKTTPNLLTLDFKLI